MEKSRCSAIAEQQDCETAETAFSHGQSHAYKLGQGHSRCWQDAGVGGQSAPAKHACLETHQLTSIVLMAVSVLGMLAGLLQNLHK